MGGRTDRSREQCPSSHLLSLHPPPCSLEEVNFLEKGAEQGDLGDSPSSLPSCRVWGEAVGEPTLGLLGASVRLSRAEPSEVMSRPDSAQGSMAAPRSTRLATELREGFSLSRRAAMGAEKEGEALLGTGRTAGHALLESTSWG